MGLSALALEGNPVFPTYPNRIPAADVSAGLVLPDAAVALLGKGGAAATLLIVFFAVTSALSSERKSYLLYCDVVGLTSHQSLLCLRSSLTMSTRLTSTLRRLASD